MIGFGFVFVFSKQSVRMLHYVDIETFKKLYPGIKDLFGSPISTYPKKCILVKHFYSKTEFTPSCVSKHQFLKALQSLDTVDHTVSTDVLVSKVRETLSPSYVPNYSASWFDKVKKKYAIQ